jgi:cysteine synthase A
LCGLLAKLEFFNPIASVKDRIGVAMIEALEADGHDRARQDHAGRADLRQHRHRAGLRRRRQGLPADPGDARDHVVERRKMLAAGRGAGADRRPQGHEGRHRPRRGAAGEIPGAVMPQQFENPANPEIHRNTTAEEIWNDTDGKVDVSSPASAPAAPSPASARCSRRASPACMWSRSSRRTAGPVRRQPGPHKIQGIGAGFVPAFSTPRL